MNEAMSMLDDINSYLFSDITISKGTEEEKDEDAKVDEKPSGKDQKKKDKQKAGKSEKTTSKKSKDAVSSLATKETSSSSSHVSTPSHGRKLSRVLSFLLLTPQLSQVPSNLLHRVLRLSFIARHWTLFDNMLNLLDTYSVEYYTYLKNDNMNKTNLGFESSSKPEIKSTLPVYSSPLISSSSPPSYNLLAEASLLSAIVPLLKESTVPSPKYDYYNSIQNPINSEGNEKSQTNSLLPPRYRIVRLPFIIPLSTTGQLMSSSSPPSDSSFPTNDGDDGIAVQSSSSSSSSPYSSSSSSSSSPATTIGSSTSASLFYLPYHLIRLSFAFQSYLFPYFPASPIQESRMFGGDEFIFFFIYFIIIDFFFFFNLFIINVYIVLFYLIFISFCYCFNDDHNSYIALHSTYIDLYHQVAFPFFSIAYLFIGNIFVLILLSPFQHPPSSF
jgi:hypothetical protein